ncbi:uncharacterized protein LOC122062648 [Macadamia integrifolia]|uniref:uncharacterized protein LOC122062648 n=1 Tax=Macadamia integrifolia TaxID=60698 RepID=UPI001C4F7559|nr:uncharacterized protein LOC122062648 [Macadamia integrifolia]
MQNVQQHRGVLSRMAEKQPDNDDDEGFGDFKFVSPSSNGSLYVNQDNGVEDEWGDFMDNFSQKQDFFGNRSLFQPFNGFTQTLNPTNPSQDLKTFDLFGDFSDHSTKATDSKLDHVECESYSVSSVAEKRWEKPQGALPLSIFGEEEVELESESNDPSVNDTPDPFPAKQSPSPVKNDVNFGPGLRLNDLIVNLYSEADQIKIENGSNSNLVDDGRGFKDAFSQNKIGNGESPVKVKYSQTDQIKIENGSNSNLVDGYDNIDDNGWEFNDAFSQNKVGDGESAVKVELTSDLSGVQVGKTTGTTIDQQFEVSDKWSQNPQGTLHKSGLRNGGLDSGDIFANSDWFSHKPAGVDNGFGLSTSMATQNDSISVSFIQANQNVNGNGLKSKSADDNFWDFKDAFSESGGVNFSSGKKEEQKVASFLDADGKVLAFDGKVQVSDKQSENSEGTLHKSGLRNGGLDSGDIFANSDWFSHKSAGLDNGFGLSTSMVTQNGSISVSCTKDNQNVNGNGLNSKSGGGKIDADDNFWDFKDAFSESGDVNSSSGKKEDQRVAGFPDSDVKVPAFDSKVQGNGKGHGDHQESSSLLSYSNGKLDADDSLFGKDVSSHKPANYVRNSTYDQGFGPNVSLTDFIDTLYSQAREIPAVNSRPTGDELSSVQVGVNSDLMNGEDDFDENSWEFKDAFSEIKADDEFRSIHADVSSANSTTGKPTEAQVGLNSDLMNGEDDFDESSWEFKDASPEIKTEGKIYVFNLSDTDKRFLSESKLKNFVDFYSRLKEESYRVALHHLDCLKEAQKVAALSGNDVKAMALFEEIQAVYKKLHKEEKTSEETYSKDLSTRKIYVNEFMNDPTFQVLESEYDLSRRISLAENDLNSAIELFEHAILMLKILSLGSVEEQSRYITTWSKMISACAQELKHGALIWKKSLLQTIHNKILSQVQGQRYFLALAEIYRVVEVLKASTTLYKPWILSNLKDPSVIFALLEECRSVWSESGLEEAVRSIPDPVSVGYDGTVMALLESIKSIHDLDVLALQNRVFSQRESICQLSGLSHAVVPDMKVVVWDGEHYFLKLANLWVNRISCDPPKTPHLRINYDDC